MATTIEKTRVRGGVAVLGCLESGMTASENSPAFAAGVAAGLEDLAACFEAAVAAASEAKDAEFLTECDGTLRRALRLARSTQSALAGGSVEDLPVVLSLLGEAKRRLAKLQHETSHSLAKLQGRLPNDEEAKLLALAKEAPTGEQIAAIREKRGFPQAWYDDDSNPLAE